MDEIPKYRGFECGSATVLADIERIDTSLSSYMFYVFRIEFDPGRPDLADDAPRQDELLAAYALDETGADAVELRFGGDSVSDKHALAMAVAGLQALLSPLFFQASMRALEQLGEPVLVEAPR